jgi:hypothetical protein
MGVMEAATNLLEDPEGIIHHTSVPFPFDSVRDEEGPALVLERGIDASISEASRVVFRRRRIKEEKDEAGLRTLECRQVPLGLACFFNVRLPGVSDLIYHLLTAEFPAA